MSKIYQKHISAVKNPAKRLLGGFTLVELLVVVLIIGILAAVALPKYQKAVIKARIARVLPLLKSVQEAQERFYMANGYYTTNKEDLDINWQENGMDLHGGVSLWANKVGYSFSGPGIFRCYQFANRAEDNTCPEVARGKFVCNGYGSDSYKQICLNLSENTLYPWVDYITYW